MATSEMAPAAASGRTVIAWASTASARAGDAATPSAWAVAAAASSKVPT